QVPARNDPAQAASAPSSPRRGRTGNLRRHVLLIMFGQYFIGHKHALAIQAAVRNHALTLAKKIRQYLVVRHGYITLEIGDDETDLQTARHALYAACLDHAAQAKGPIPVRGTRGHFARNKIQRDVLAKG